MFFMCCACVVSMEHGVCVTDECWCLHLQNWYDVAVGSGTERGVMFNVFQQWHEFILNPFTKGAHGEAMMVTRREWTCICSNDLGLCWALRRKHDWLGCITFECDGRDVGKHLHLTHFVYIVPDWNDRMAVKLLLAAEPTYIFLQWEFEKLLGIKIHCCSNLLCERTRQTRGRLRKGR